MSNQSGVSLFEQSMNGLINIDNADQISVYELDAEIINVDNLVVNNLLTTPNISNTTIGTITQINTNTISQTGTGTNILKNTDISGNLHVGNNVDISGNLSVSGTLTYDVLDIDCENLIVQNDASLNNVNISGDLVVQQTSNFIGDVSMNNVNITGDLVVQQTSNFIGDVSMNNVNISGDLHVDNVLDTISEDYINNINQNLENSGFGILTFSVSANASGTFEVSFICPISIKENGIRPTTGNQTTSTTFNSCTAELYKNSVYTGSSISVSSSNGYGIAQTFIIQGLAVGVIPYNYQKYITTFTGSFTITHTASSSVTAYAIRLVLSRSDVSPVAQIQKIVMINTTFSGYTQSGIFSNTPALIANFQSVGNTFDSGLTSYNNYTGILENNKLINNTIFNSQDITTQGLISTNITSTRIINNYISITTSTYTLISSNSYYFISRSGNTQINLPYLDNIFTGFTIWIRKVQPTNNINTININASVNGCRYFDNMTFTTTNITYNNEEKVISLLYGGSGDWFLLNLL